MFSFEFFGLSRNQKLNDMLELAHIIMFALKTFIITLKLWRSINNQSLIVLLVI